MLDGPPEEAGDICEKDTQDFYHGAQSNLFLAPVAKQVNEMRLRKAGAGKSSCTSGVELFPRSWTPLFFYVVPLAGPTTPKSNRSALHSVCIGGSPRIIKKSFSQNNFR
jgi:hypothetical protein